MDHLTDYIQGYVDGLKDAGEWHEMTKAQQKQAVLDALPYFDKIDYGFSYLRRTLLALGG